MRPGFWRFDQAKLTLFRRPVSPARSSNRNSAQHAQSAGPAAGDNDDAMMRHRRCEIEESHLGCMSATCNHADAQAGGLSTQSPDQLRILHVANSPITSSSSPAFAILWQPPPNLCGPGSPVSRSTSAPSSIVISTPRPASMPNCARTGLGVTTPWEFPIRRMLACIARIVTTM